MTPTDDLLARLDRLAGMMRLREHSAHRPIDRQLWAAKAEAYENCAAMVRRTFDVKPGFTDA